LFSGLTDSFFQRGLIDSQVLEEKLRKKRLPDAVFLLLERKQPDHFEEIFEGLILAFAGVLNEQLNHVLSVVYDSVFDLFADFGHIGGRDPINFVACTTFAASFCAILLV